MGNLRLRTPAKIIAVLLAFLLVFEPNKAQGFDGFKAGEELGNYMEDNFGGDKTCNFLNQFYSDLKGNLDSFNPDYVTEALNNSYYSESGDYGVIAQKIEQMTDDAYRKGWPLSVSSTTRKALCLRSENEPNQLINYTSRVTVAGEKSPGSTAAVYYYDGAIKTSCSSNSSPFSCNVPWGLDQFFWFQLTDNSTANQELIHLTMNDKVVASGLNFGPARGEGKVFFLAFGFPQAGKVDFTYEYPVEPQSYDLTEGNPLTCSLNCPFSETVEDQGQLTCSFRKTVANYDQYFCSFPDGADNFKPPPGCFSSGGGNFNCPHSSPPASSILISYQIQHDLFRCPTRNYQTICPEANFRERQDNNQIFEKPHDNPHPESITCQYECIWLTSEKDKNNIPHHYYRCPEVDSAFCPADCFPGNPEACPEEDFCPLAPGNILWLCNYSFGTPGKEYTDPAAEEDNCVCDNNFCTCTVSAEIRENGITPISALDMGIKPSGAVLKQVTLGENIINTRISLSPAIAILLVHIPSAAPADHIDLSFWVGWDRNGSKKECFWIAPDKTCRDAWAKTKTAEECINLNLTHLYEIGKEIFGQELPFVRYEIIEQRNEYPGVSCYGAHENDWFQFWQIRLYPPLNNYTYLCPLGNYPCEPDPAYPENYYCTSPGMVGLIPTDTVDLSSKRKEEAEFITESCENKIVCLNSGCTRTEVKKLCRYCLKENCWDNDYEDLSSDFGEALTYMEIAAEIGQDMKGLRVFNGFKETCVSEGGLIFTVDCCKELGSNAEEVGKAVSSLQYAYGAYKYGKAIYTAITTPKYVISAVGTVEKVVQAGEAAAGAVNALSALEVSQVTGNYSLVFKEAGEALFQSAFGPGSLSSIFSASTLVSVTIAVAVYFLIQFLTYTCKASDAPAAIKSKLGYCHYNGKYCAKRSLFGCLVKRKSYCCFQSKLARIIQEQGRNQIGRRWGGAKHPDCTGFTAEEIGQLDFSQMDFTEVINEIIQQYTSRFEADEKTSAFALDLEKTFNQNLESFINTELQNRVSGGMILPGGQ